MDSAAIPIVWARSDAKLTKASEQTRTVGMPFFSRAIESWTLHDVQDPQSAIALITTSALWATCESNASPASWTATSF